MEINQFALILLDKQQNHECPELGVVNLQTGQTL